MTLSSIGRRGVLASGFGLAAAGFAGTARGRHLFREDPFTLSVAAGDPAPDGFVIWTRLAPHPIEASGGMPGFDVELGWEVAADPQFRHVVRRGPAVAVATLAHSVHVEVNGLLPHRPYWYRFVAPDNLPSPIGIARTLPLPGAEMARARIAVVGCQDYERGLYTAYRHLAAEPDLDAVFHYGDYIYEFGPRSDNVVRRHWGGEATTLADYRLRYAQYKLDPDLQAAHAAAAFIMSFDDHEIDDNWAGEFGKDTGATAAFAARKAAAFQAWYEHMPVRPAMRPGGSGVRCYRRFDFGRLMRMHVLDTRSYRSRQECEGGGMTAEQRDACTPQYPPGRTMLGVAQEAWLDAGLSNDAAWNFVAQQVMMMPYDARKDGETVARRSTDNWNGYPQARRRFVETIRRHGLTNVVVGSGDMHQNVVGYIPADPDDPSASPVASEFLATSISSGGTGDLRHPNELRALNNNPNALLLNNQRGYHLHSATAQQWSTEVKVVDQVHRPGGLAATFAKFAVDPRRPAPEAG